MSLYSVKAVTATAGGPSTFALSKDNGTDQVLSSSALVQQLFLDAFFTGASVEVELVPGSNVVKRVKPFEAGKAPIPFPSNEYRVARLATQRMPNGRDEHLEVFLKKGQDPEKAYNVYDPLLQQVLEAAFGSLQTASVPVLHVEFDGEEIASLRVGNKLQ